MTAHIEKAWEKDVDVRRHGLEQGDSVGYKVEVHEIKPGVVYRDTTEWPEHYSSTVNLVEQGDDGGQIELEISLDDADADKAPALIAELRCCGFIGGLQNTP